MNSSSVAAAGDTSTSNNTANGQSRAESVGEAKTDRSNSLPDNADPPVGGGSAPPMAQPRSLRSTVSSSHYGGTSDTASDRFSVTSDGQYEVIEYNPFDQINLEDPFEGFEPKIEDDSPAAEALRANADVKVSTVGKAARAMHIQTLRRIAKRATLQGKSGYRKGKPPNLPPRYRPEDVDEGEELEAVEVSVGPPDGLYAKEDISESATSEGGPAIPTAVVAGTAAAGKEVLNDVDPHDMIKTLRWTRRSKLKEKSKRKSYVKGKVINGQHELYTLSIAVMIGVRTSISRANAVLNAGVEKRWIQPEDFRTAEKYEFRPTGGGVTPPHRLAHTFKFKDYSPVVFAYLRRMYGINEFDFLLSLCGNANFIEFISNAKSGQFFFYSSDGKYMIKTMTNSESKFLRKILPQYFKHCAENPNTMLTRFFGMYRVKMYHLRRNVKFVIMNSVYYTDKHLNVFYDLKGSTIGRNAKPKDAVWKDNDMRKGLPNDALALEPHVKQRVVDQLVQDCNFLQRNDIIDYSMLVGVHLHTLNGNSSVVKGKAEVDEKDNETRRPHKRYPSEQIGQLFIDDGLDDDESSFLLGSEKRPYIQSPHYREETEIKKLATIEKLYWPFHNLFDIHGNRLMKPARCPSCGKRPCMCRDDALKLLSGYNIPSFVEPLSDRKDRGYEMDTTNFPMPQMFSNHQGTIEYSGKTFYMGIIDILQQYNTRKRFEARYRMIQNAGRNDASAIPPKPYGDRFISFFREYTQGKRNETERDVGYETCAYGEALGVGRAGD